MKKIEKWNLQIRINQISKILIMNQQIRLISFLVLFAFGCQSQIVQKNIDLSGEWKFAIDSLDKGTSEKWFAQELPGTIQLPGSMTLSGKGDPVGYKTKFTGGLWKEYPKGKSWTDEEN